MALLNSLYQILGRRNSINVGFVLTGAFFGSRAFESFGESLWESNNKGKLFKDIVAEQQANA